MRFLDTGEKVKKLRKELSIKQSELDTTGVSRNFISMIENGKRKLHYTLALKLLDIFQKKAQELGKEFNADVKWLMASSKEQAAEFCRERLNSELTAKDVDLLTDLVKEYNITELIYRVYSLKADNLYDNKQYEEAFTFYYRTKDYLGETSEEKAFIFNKLGKCKFMMLNYIEAILYFNKCYKISLTQNYNESSKNSLYNLALSYRKLGNTMLAMQCIDSCLSLCDINNNFTDYMGAAILKSNCYADMGLHNEAISILNTCADKFKDPEDVLLGYIYNSLGSLYLEISKFDDALYYLNKAYYIRKNKDILNLPRTLLNKADIFIRKECLYDALDLIYEALLLTEENKDTNSVLKAYSLLETIYIKVNNLEELKKLYFKMLDVFNSTEKKEDSLKTYIKLLKIVSDSDNRCEYKNCLEEALKLV